MTDTTATTTLINAGIDAQERPDGLFVVQCTDGGCVIFGEADSDGWWDYTAYDAEDRILATDGAKTLEGILPALRQWTA